ncbi:hypothetical protein ACFFX1_11675 [Dactylosporangium sucinum]|uniref:Uncharacterized protein n=1 Tax=Dactylosporangium sucinum TaxID=1424081 RepID=A0A917TLR8_9ACTN|nr:hypothetical protein [Dactylosporangium sucinum]GGM27933.1 hypothetical protein GCM10007977_031570 [Dactylosporangium sucinum]
MTTPAGPAAAPATTTTTTAATAPATAPDPSAPKTTGGQPAAAGQPAAGADPAGAAAPVEAVDSGSWSEPGQATARSGEGTARREHWTAARNIYGDHVAGHKIVLRIGDKTLPVPELSADLSDPVHYAFVDPDNWLDLCDRFRDQRTAIVRGPGGAGKDASAIRLLTGEVERVYHLDPAVEMLHLAESITEQAGTLGGGEGGVGFLLCQPHDAGKLRGFLFHALEKALTKANARLVITMPTGVLPPDNDLEQYVLDLPEQRVSRRRIVSSHLSWRLSDELAEKTLANAAVRELIEELERGDHSCQSAAELAWIISSECSDAGVVNAARVRERRRRQRGHAFDRWFDSLRDADERSFAISLAVLDGLPFEDVSDAARRLRRRMEPSRQLVVSATAQGMSELRMGSPDLLRGATARLLQSLRADEVDEEQQFAYGTAPVRIVRYKDGSYPQQVLERVWRGYHIQPTVLEWLHELVISPSEAIRFYAASALGELCRYSFDYVHAYYLARWAASKDYRVREAVAYALRVAGRDPRLAVAVATVVGGWYANKDQPYLQATAARAYGVGVGVPDAATAVDRLGRLATIDDYWIAVAIGDALADLILEDEQTVAPMACGALLEWFENRRRVRPAQLAFLILASTLVFWEPAEAGRPPARWPTLLRLATTLEPLRAPLIGLWRRVLSESVLHEEARGVLSGWAALAENDPAQLDDLGQLVGAALWMPEWNRRIETILGRLARDWVAEENLVPLPNARKTVTALFSAEES